MTVFQNNYVLHVEAPQEALNTHRFRLNEISKATVVLWLEQNPRRSIHQLMHQLDTCLSVLGIISNSTPLLRTVSRQVSFERAIYDQ